MQLKEKIFSIPAHMSNEHCFEDNKYHKYCEHEVLTDEEKRLRPWMKKTAEVHKISTAFFDRAK